MPERRWRWGYLTEAVRDRHRCVMCDTPIGGDEGPEPVHVGVATRRDAPAAPVCACGPCAEMLGRRRG